MTTLSLNTLKNVSPGWWGAVTGAAIAGATLVPSSRVLAGALGGAAMLALAIKFSGPCCAECADKAGTQQEQAQVQAPSGAAPMSPDDFWAHATANTSGDVSTSGGLDAPAPPAPTMSTQTVKTAPPPRTTTTTTATRLRAAILGAPSPTTVRARA